MNETKRCSRCKQEKPVGEFSIRRSNPDGLWNYCKDCDSKRRPPYEYSPQSPTKRRPKRYQAQAGAAHNTAKRYGTKINTLTSKEWLAMLNESGGKCHWCGEVFGIDKLVPDHVMPLSKGGPNSIDNVVPSCRFCNCSKRDRKRPVTYNIANARYAIKKLDGNIKLETPEQRHWWKLIMDSMFPADWVD